ncbi:MAG: radical SAM protein [PVC group bacterium]|nr:radical SAM protein [PVC group bacterium]
MTERFELYREQWEQLPKNNTVSSFPLHLDIELNTSCNLRCNMCPFYGPNAIYIRPPMAMPLGLFKQIINEGVQHSLCSVKLNFAGEPLLYKNIIEAIRYAKYKGVLDVQINTNGLLLDTDLIEKLINAGLDLLILSDYQFEEQYNRIVILQSLKQLKGVSNPIVRVKTDFPNLWINIADEVVNHKFFDYNKTESNFKKSDFKCLQPWRRMLILVDGTACKCSCGMLNPDKQMNKIKDMKIIDMWNSQTMSFLRACHAQGDSHLVSMCRMCPSRNEYIDNNINKKNNNRFKRLKRLWV